MTKQIYINDLKELEINVTPTLVGLGQREGVNFVEQDGTFFINSMSRFGGYSDLHPLTAEDVKTIVNFFQQRETIILPKE